MPGTFVFKPIEANITHSTDMLGKMSPYCAFIIGNDKIKSAVSNKGGKHPHWNDTVTVPSLGNESKIMVQVMDKDRLTKDDVIGDFMIDLREVQTQGQLSRWYPLTYKNKAAGEILLESYFRPEGMLSGQAGFAAQTGYTNQGGYLDQAGYNGQSGYTSNQQGFVQSKQFGSTQQSSFGREEVILNQVPDNKVFIEQRQVVEPHTYMKEVDVVETRPHTQAIEVMEPVKVLKDVQYTQAVPVTKQIEIVEPQVVMKEVEVIEPRLVTKQIQVIENVPVKRQVEVIESRTRIQEVETLEPQTFTKQVEVTEHVPVIKEVQVTEPVHLKKAVEFVEPVITTKTITKQLQEAVVVDEAITQTVGPATIVGETETMEQQFVGKIGTNRTGLRTSEADVYSTNQLTGQVTKNLLGSEGTHHHSRHQRKY